MRHSPSFFKFLTSALPLSKHGLTFFLPSTRVLPCHLPSVLSSDNSNRTHPFPLLVSLFLLVPLHITGWFPSRIIFPIPILLLLILLPSSVLFSLHNTLLSSSFSHLCQPPTQNNLTLHLSYLPLTLPPPLSLPSFISLFSSFFFSPRRG